MNRIKPGVATPPRVAPVTAADVLIWFGDASESPHRKRRGRPLTAAEVAPIVKIVNAQQQWLWRPPSHPRVENRNAAAIHKLRQAQAAIQALRHILPAVLEVYRQAGLDHLTVANGALVVQKHPEEVALRRILDAVKAAPDYLAIRRQAGQSISPVCLPRASQTRYGGHGRLRAGTNYLFKPRTAQELQSFAEPSKPLPANSTSPRPLSPPSSVPVAGGGWAVP
jgi:hypothetical protein